MRTSRIDRSWFRYGVAVRIRAGVARKPWEWIGQIQLISGDVVSVSWRVLLPGSNGQYPVTFRLISELEPVEACAVEGEPHLLSTQIGG